MKYGITGMLRSLNHAETSRELALGRAYLRLTALKQHCFFKEMPQQWHGVGNTELNNR